MAATKINGYDPVTMQWAEIDTKNQNEDVSPTENECLQALMRLRQRTTQVNTTIKGGGISRSGTSGGARAAPQNGSMKTAQQWRPKQTPRLRSEDLIVVLKPRGTLDLKTVFKHGEVGSAVANYVGDLAAEDLSVWPVWEQNVIVCGTQTTAVAEKLIKEFDLTVEEQSYPFRGHLKINVIHRVDNCPHPEDGRCGYCGKQVGATTDGLTEHECQPSCMICRGAHLTGSADCTGTFRELQRSEATNQAGSSATPSKQPPPLPKMGKQGQQQRQPPKQKAGNKSTSQQVKPGPGKKSPTLQARDFPPLNNAPKQQVSAWAGAASQSSTPSSTPLTLKMSKQLESLRKQIAQLAAKIQALEKARAENLTPHMDDESDSASVCSGSTITSHSASIENLESLVSNIEEWLLAFTEQMTQLPNMITQAVQAAIQLQTQHMVATVTQQVTQSIQTWLSSNPRF
ncbi:hypothetical protein HPB52_022468 [Rhipicephalus sanguineus]|uniref:Uncharacterized protein n=1 Tax=Rhipicephalus sanguineus TaxID=34632 RepID=A0A9D4Q465_RHISA|nr:hypothetical protein HPB52_022468 [Rhipicephalus sanguineus]